MCLWVKKSFNKLRSLRKVSVGTISEICYLTAKMVDRGQGTKVFEIKDTSRGKLKERFLIYSSGLSIWDATP